MDEFLVLLFSWGLWEGHQLERSAGVALAKDEDADRGREVVCQTEGGGLFGRHLEAFDRLAAEDLGVELNGLIDVFHDDPNIYYCFGKNLGFLFGVDGCKSEDEDSGECRGGW